MKKVLLGLFLLVILTVTAVFIFIPSQLHISAVTVMKTNTNSLYRYLSDEANWKKWWPNDSQEKELTDETNHPTFNDFTYRLSKKLYNAIDVQMVKKDQVIDGKILIIQVAQDSAIVQWQSALTTSLNPVKRLLRYQEAVNIKKNITVILDSLKSFNENKEKVYGISINHTTLKDTTLVAIKTVTSSYPSTSDIYKLVENLQTYIASQKAKQVDFPILNITKKDSLHYNLMVAIATDRTLNGKGKIAFKRMIAYKDKILTADVKGGPEKINQAYDGLNTFMKDYNLTSPVIPWETLVTDRSKEPDHTKWVTKICIPIV